MGFGIIDKGLAAKEIADRKRVFSEMKPEEVVTIAAVISVSSAIISRMIPDVIAVTAIVAGGDREFIAALDQEKATSERLRAEDGDSPPEGPGPRRVLTKEEVARMVEQRREVMQMLSKEEQLSLAAGALVALAISDVEHREPSECAAQVAEADEAFNLASIKMMELRKGRGAEAKAAS